MDNHIHCMTCGLPIEANEYGQRQRVHTCKIDQDKRLREKPKEEWPNAPFPDDPSVAVPEAERAYVLLKKDYPGLEVRWKELPESCREQYLQKVRELDSANLIVVGGSIGKSTSLIALAAYMEHLQKQLAEVKAELALVKDEADDDQVQLQNMYDQHAAIAKRLGVDNKTSAVLREIDHLKECRVEAISLSKGWLIIANEKDLGCRGIIKFLETYDR